MDEILELIKKAQNGDSESIELILSCFKAKVSSICREYFLIGSDYDDIVQEGMIGLYKAIQSFDADKNDNFAVYASICIHRQIQSAVRLANSKKNLPLNDYFSINTEGEIETENEKSPQIILVTKDRVAEKVSLAKEQNSKLQEEIKKLLNETQYRILCLYLNGYSYSEIAVLLNLNTKKVDNSIQVIKKKLKDIKFD